MPTKVNLDSVATADVAPAVAPHVISNKASKDVAQVGFTVDTKGLQPRVGLRPGAGLKPSPSAPFPGSELLPGIFNPGERPVVAFRVRLGGVSPHTGVLLGGRGTLCGDALCGDDFPDAWFADGPAAVSEAVEYAETGAPADGNQTVNIWAARLGGPWSV